MNGFHGFLSVAQSVLRVGIHRWVYTCQHVLCKKVKIFSGCCFHAGLKVTPISPHPAGIAVPECPAVSPNAADIRLAYLTGIIRFLPAFRSVSWKMPVWRNW